ncbi:MAG: hypothetical protein II359_03815 [Clostridia bacterium]|nr:hypothetical protein [Clostridia bacterium]
MQNQRQVVVIPLSSPLFEEAVFFLRKNAHADEGSIISEAERIALSCLHEVSEPPYMYKKKCKSYPLWVSLALCATAAASILTFFLIR